MLSTLIIYLSFFKKIFPIKKLRFTQKDFLFILVGLFSPIFSSTSSNAQDCEYYGLEVCEKIDYGPDCYRWDYGPGNCDVSGQDPDCIY